MREKYRNSIASIKKFSQFTTMHVIDGQAGLIICASLIFYSLTIDNILNIIVLLILAGVSISMISGDDGLLTKTTEAKQKTELAGIKEEIQLATLASYDTHGQFNGDLLLENLNKINGLTAAASVKDGKISYPVIIATEKNMYEMDSDTELKELVPGLYYADSDEMILTWAELFDENIGNMMLNPDARNDGILARASFNLDNVKDKNGNTVGNGNGNVKLIVDKSITKIGATVNYYSMGGLSPLGEIILPPTITSINGGCFGSCNYLKSVTIPSGEIGASAFPNLSNLETVILGNKVTSIGATAFVNCSKLAGITIPDSVTTLGDQAFLGCSALKTAKIGTGIETYGTSIFHNDYNLETFVIGSEGAGLVAYQTGGMGGTIPGTFGNIFGNLKNVTVGSKVETIPAGMFACNYQQIETITLENGIKVIGERAFYNTKITEITIPDSVTTLGEGIVSNCNSLETIIVGNGVTSLSTFGGYNANPSNLKNVKLGNSITEIPNNMFQGYSNLENIKLGNNITSIGNNAFAGTKIKECIMPDSVTTLGTGIFTGCQELENIVISNNVTTISQGTLGNSGYLKSIDLGNGITVIPDDCFTSYQELKKVKLGNNVTKIGANAFYYCIKLKEINLPDTLTEIGTFSFVDCKSLESIKLPASLTTMGTQVFKRCTSLKTIAIPEGITSIGNYTFSNCTNLESITIPASVTSIENCAFDIYQGKLRDVYYKGTESQWNSITVGVSNSALSNATIHYNS